MDYSRYNSWTFEEKIKFLKYCAEKYETDGSSPISDSEYDKIYYELEKINPDHPFFQEVGGIDEEHIYGAKIKHEIIMGSLSKCPTIEDFKDWLPSHLKNINNISLVFQHKIDGLSLSLHYKDSKLIMACTRGDGEFGIDVTENAINVNGVPKTINCKDELFIRGECYKDKEDFYKNWAKEYANCRNFASGSLNNKDANVTKERGLSFIAYEVLKKEFTLETDKIKFLDENSFNTLKNSTKKTKEGLSFDQLFRAAEIYMNSIDRPKLPYDIDGIVVKLNDIKTGDSLGSICSGKKKKSAVAIKFKPEEVMTTVLGLESNTGRTGRVTPVAILQPVQLAGTIVKRATLHNFGSLIGKDSIKIGATVTIAKRGDIIPQIIKVNINNGKEFNLPTNCPSCNQPLHWNETKIDLICDNSICPAQSVKRIENWLKTIGVKGIGPSIINSLSTIKWDNKPIISCISDIYYKLDNDRQTEHPFRKYNYLKENFGEVTYENILKSIHSVQEVPINIFVEALGIAKIGSMSKDITDIAPTIEEIDKLTVDDLTKIQGFGTVKANNFINGWKESRKEIEILLKFVKIKQNTASSNKLKDKKFCFTGSFSNPTRSEMEKLVVENSGKLGSVGKGLSALVWDQEINGNKIQKAKELNIPVITQSEFLKML